jgi:hypothetical protein
MMRPFFAKPADRVFLAIDNIFPERGTLLYYIVTGKPMRLHRTSNIMIPTALRVKS